MESDELDNTTEGTDDSLVDVPESGGEASIVEVPTTVVVEQTGSDAAQATAIVADEHAAQAEDTALAAGAVAEAAGAVAVDAHERASSLESDFSAFRAEFGEVRGYLSELHADLVSRREAETLAAEQASQVQEVPVNDAAKRDAEKRGEAEDNDSGQGSGQASSSSSSSGETRKPAQRAGLRFRGRG